MVAHVDEKVSAVSSGAVIVDIAHGIPIVPERMQRKAPSGVENDKCLKS
jgi:hypothetical protein